MTPQLQTDQMHLARAIDLAEGGRGRVSPNPMVGAVVVKDGEVLGEGFHGVYGGPHAEREALAACAGKDTRGATMYVSLEPCCHTGQTPPCTDAILEAGIARVVVASDDPTEKASGRGLGILRDEGGKGREPFSYDFSFNAYPLKYGRMGPEVRIYRLRGDRC